MTTLEKLKLLKNNTKERLRKIKNYITEKYNNNIFIIQFIITTILTIALICSLIMTKNLYKRIDNLSNQINSITVKVDSQDQAKNDVNTSSKLESNDETNTSSSIEPTDTPSDDILSPVPTPAPTPTPTPTPTPVPPVSNTPTTNSTNVVTGTSTDLDLLACVIYQEAGGNGSCDACRKRVADVVLNRVADSRFPNTIRAVLTSRNQYGRFYYTGVVWPSRAKNVNEQSAVIRAYRIAEEVLNGQHSELYGNGYVWQAGFRQGSSHIYCCGHYYGK